jgi:hypothetical protein
MESIKLSNKYTIYKGVYNKEYQIEEFLKLVKFNHNNVIHTNDNSAWIEIKSPVFDSQ